MGKWKQRCESAEKRCEIAERQLANAYDFFEKAEKRVDASTGQVSWAVPHMNSAFVEVWTRDKENGRWLMKYEDVVVETSDTTHDSPSTTPPHSP